jgi:hypothetical protein
VRRKRGSRRKRKRERTEERKGRRELKKGWKIVGAFQCPSMAIV